MMERPCFECNAPAEHEHHVIPQSLGGTNTVPLCEDCHGKVHGRDLRTRALTRAALAAKRSRGERVGTVPYGFSPGPDGTLVANDTEQAIIALVCDLRRSGKSLRRIAAITTRRGVRSRGGKPLAATQILRILQDANSGRHRLALRGAYALQARERVADAARPEDYGPLFGGAR